MGNNLNESTLDIENMIFTDQRNFFKALAETIFSKDELALDATLDPVEITKDDVVKAIKKSLVMYNLKDRISFDLTMDNMIKYSLNHIKSIMELFKTGKMAENIQTLDNDKEDKEAYKAFNLTSLENKLYAKISRMSDKEKDKILNIKISNKELATNYIDSFDEYDIKSHFVYLTGIIFKDRMGFAEDHIYDTNTNTDSIQNEKNEKDYLIGAELTKENITRYAREVKALNDMMNKKPWYVRWFSESYSRKKQALENVKVILYNRGVSKDSLKKFLKSDGSIKAQDVFFKANESSIEKINKTNNEKIEKVSSAQKDFNLKNFSKEQEFNELSKKTLENLSIVKEDKDVKEQFDKKRKEIKEDKDFYNECLTSPKFNNNEKEAIRTLINDMDSNLDYVNKLESEIKNKKEDLKDDDLKFDPKDIMDSSDSLQNKLTDEFDDELIEETLNAFSDKDKEEISEKKI